MKKKVGWLIYKEEDCLRNQGAIGLFREAGSRLGMEIRLAVLGPEPCFSNRSPGSSGFPGNLQGIDPPGDGGRFPDLVINRSREYAVSAWFETRGIRVSNPSEVTRICNDKALTLELAEKAGIPVLPWRLGEEDGVSFGYPAVAKSCGGHGGTEVYLAKSQEELDQIRQKFAGKKWILQKPASELGKDVRVYVVGNRIVQAMLRVSASDFRSNYSLGGLAEPYVLTEQERALVEKTVSILKPDYIAVDLLTDNGRPVLNEAEDPAGARMLYAHAKIDIIAEYMEYILKKG